MLPILPAGFTHCRCCGVVLHGPRAILRRCPLCDWCDRKHGAEREAAVIDLVRYGQYTAWEAIGQFMIDDAHHAGRIEFRGDQSCATIWIERPVLRWEVVIGRAIARGELPSGQEIVGSIMARYVPGPWSGIAALASDLKDALSTLDPRVIDVVVSCDRDVLDAAHLVVNVIHTHSDEPPIVMSPDVEIPADITQRPRGQA